MNVSKNQKKLPLIATLNELSWEFRNSNADSALFYAMRSLTVSKAINNDKAIASAYNNIASSFETLNKIDSAEIYHQKGLEIKLKINDTIGIADTYCNIGIVEDIKGNYDLALINYFKALNIYEKHSKDFEKVPTVLVNIGIVYKKQKEYEKVLNYYQRALLIYEENNFEIGEAIVTGNIGSVFTLLKDYKKSIEYSEKAARLYKKLGYTRYVPYMKSNMAVAKDSLKQHEEARIDFLSAISDFKNDKNLYELSNTQISLANNYVLTSQYTKAKKLLFEALEIIEENNYVEFKIDALKSLAKLEALTGDYYSAYNNFEAYSQAKDAFLEVKKIKTIYELETKYQTEKKEKEILSQRADLAEKELHINQKNTQIIGLSILAIVLSILGYLVYKQQNLKNEQLKKEGELKEALVKIETQNKLNEQRLKISRDLHDNIGAQLTFIISSIDNLQYGFKITNEKLTNKLSYISAFTKDTIYELRDTIWAMNKNAISLEDLQGRISNFIDNADASSSSIKFDFNIDESLSKELEFKSVMGMNIYRIIQEAINNAIKYSEASNVNVNIEKLKSNIKFTVKDNGKGFEENNVMLGNGLNNMKKRAHDISATFKIKSSLNKGTSVILEI
ncbi:tetratricopeptide repeat-containing sensor histidine kinase [Thalassobellus sediminis]|uniref:tetratricopeptide repeat-containing sensor histidine kinase n=1 Tax=Thalassobellus sediminis TaxID=3367753 RepID=UPI003793FA0B